MTCAAYTTRTVTVARGARRYVPCVQPATQERTYVEHSAAGDRARIVHLCPRHVGMFDRGQHGILDSRA